MMIRPVVIRDAESKLRFVIGRPLAHIYDPVFFKMTLIKEFLNLFDRVPIKRLHAF